MTWGEGARGRGWPRWRLDGALLASLLVHGLLLSLSFAGDGSGLPGLELPWQTRRAEAPELRVRLDAAPALPPAAAAPARAAVGALPGIAPAPTPDAAPAAAAEANAEPSAAPLPDAEPAPALRTLSPAEALGELAPVALGGPALLAVERPAAWAVAASGVPAAAMAALSASEVPAVESLRPAAAGLRVGRDGAGLAELEGLRPAAPVGAFAAASAPAVEALRRNGDGLRLQAEAGRTTLAGLDGALQPAGVGALAAAPGVSALRRADGLARGEADAGGRAAELAQLERAGQLARQGAQQLEAARLDAERREAARTEAARMEAARAAAARLAEARAEEEVREARRRAIGRQLDEEAARRDAERERPDWTPARRGRLFGRIDTNAELALYGEAWARRIQNNQELDAPLRELARQPHVAPIVTVAVRSNGSVESIRFVRSSGLPALDAAVERIVRAHENYPAFPPALLRDFDVVEIRRSWHFDIAIRLD